MSGDPERPLSESNRTGQSRQEMPAASPPAIASDSERRERNAAARFAGVGFQFAATLLVSVWLGNWLDRRFGTAPVFLYGGVFLGAGAAFYSMYRQLMANLERDEQARRARNRGRDDASSAGGSQ